MHLVFRMFGYPRRSASVCQALFVNGYSSTSALDGKPEGFIEFGVVTEDIAALLIGEALGGFLREASRAKGITAAVDKFGVSRHTIRKWIKMAGPAPEDEARLGELEGRIADIMEEIGELRPEFEGLRRGL